MADAMVPEEKIRSVLNETGVDVVVATSLENVFYSTGVWTTMTITPSDENYQKTGYFTDFDPPRSFAVWSVNRDEPFLVAPPNVATHIPDENIDFNESNVLIYGQRNLNTKGLDTISEKERSRLTRLFDSTFENRVEAIVACIEPLIDSTSTIAIEDLNRSSYVYNSIDKRLNYGKIREAEGIFQRLRMVKTEEEITRIRRSTQINKEAIEESLEKIEEGMTERELASIYNKKIYEKNAIEQKPVEHTMIGFGPHSAYAHVVPGDYELQRGDLIRFEVGCRYNHYAADLARTYVFGESNRELEKYYQVIHSALEKCESLLKDGVSASEVYNKTKQHIQNRAGEADVPELIDFNPPMIGHNIGLDIHDPPLLSDRDVTIKSGVVMNYEFNFAQWGLGAVQLEETALVTEDGVETFSSCPETLRVVE